MLKLWLLRAPQVSSVRQFEEVLSSVGVGPAGTGKVKPQAGVLSALGATHSLGEGGNWRERGKKACGPAVVSCTTRTVSGKEGLADGTHGRRVLSTLVSSFLAAWLWADCFTWRTRARKVVNSNFIFTRSLGGLSHLTQHPADSEQPQKGTSGRLVI